MTFERVPVKRFLSKIGSGSTPSGGAETYVDSGVAFLRSQNVQMGSLDLSDVAFIPQETDAAMAGTRVRAHDVLLNITGASLGRVASVAPGFQSANVNQHVCILRPRNATYVCSRFVEYAMQSNEVQHSIFNQQVGGNREGLNFDQVGDLRVPSPPVTEQRAIADYLDAETARIDALITKKRRMIELFNDRQTSHASELIFGPGSEAGGAFPFAGGSDPREMRRNKTFMHEVNASSTSGAEEMLSVSHLTGVTPRSEKTVYMFEAVSTVGYKLVEPGDLVVNTMWAWMGAAGVSRHYGIVSPAYGVYRLDPEIVVPSYFDLLVRTPAYICEMTRFSRGVTSSRLRLYPDELLALFSPLPPIDEQKRMVGECERNKQSTSELMAQLTRQVDLLAERRQALITAAVTGELKIPGVAA